MKLIYFGATWPQPWVTAAGVRTIGLINAFKEFGYSIKFLSIKKPNPSQIKWILDTQTEHHFCPINDENAFKSLVSDENLCIFETANIEQMFGHMVNTHLPDCKRILDTQDLHFLRKSREKLVHTKSIDEIKNIKTDWKDPETSREISSMLRSHLTILTSEYERQLIKHNFPYLNTVCLPFFYSDKEIDENQNKYAKLRLRKDFVWIGNFTHPPNSDAVNYMVSEIWPEIRKALGCELHLYGAHCPSVSKWSSQGLVVKGPMESLSKLSKYRMLLAPIRYGAGVKGKITDSFLYGLPVLTTSIGAEGIDPFPGFVADSKEELVAKAIRHYNDYTSLRNCQLWGWQLLRDKFSDSKNSHRLKASLTSLADTPLQLIMFGESLRSSYYFSKFLEAKQNLKE